MQEFGNKLAIVTGAAQGIGAAVAWALAKGGARLVLLDVKPQQLAATAAQIAATGAQVHHFVLDVSSSQAVNAIITQIEQQLGAIEILVNVAGILKMGTVLQYSDADWEQTFAVNVGGVFRMTRAVATHMQARKRGVIVTVSSNAASVPRQQMAAYAASKAASSHFMRCLGLELAQDGIRCNIVSPGSTDTEMQRQLWQGGDEAAAAQAVIDGSLSGFRLGIPLARIADGSDIADAVCFLASDRARHITLHDLRVDGGASLAA